MEAELTVHRMSNLNHRELIGDELTEFFTNLEATDVVALMQANNLIWNKNKGRIVTGFQDIKGCKRSISIGLVHEISVNRSHPEVYESILPQSAIRELRPTLQNIMQTFSSASGVCGKKEGI